MKVESKFDIGDRVLFTPRNRKKKVEGTIVNCSIFISKSGYVGIVGIIVRYWVEWKNKNGVSQSDSFNEKNLEKI